MAVDISQRTNIASVFDDGSEPLANRSLACQATFFPSFDILLLIIRVIALRLLENCLIPIILNIYCSNMDCTLKGNLDSKVKFQLVSACSMFI